METIKIAWRNIWRNKRRTMITAAALYLAVVISILMRSLQIGTYDIMIDNAVGNYLGFIQIQHPEYLKEKTIDEIFVNDPKLTSKLAHLKEIEGLNPRLESFALASSGDKTKPVLLQGIDPAKENKLTQLENKLVVGEYLSNNDDGVLVAQRLANFLELSVGDSLILISQGYRGVSAADLLPIRGIVKIPSPLLDSRLVIGSLSNVQNFYSAPNMVSALVVNIHSRNDVDEILPQINQALNQEEMTALGWEQIDKALKQQIESDNIGGIVMVGILYLVIFFGLLGTIIMMTTERLREFAVMNAVGMHRIKIFKLAAVETYLLGLLSLAAGFISTLPIIAYYHNNPILMGGEVVEMFEQYGMEASLGFSMDPIMLLSQAGIVLLLLSVTVIYPMLKISAFSLIKTLRG